MLLILRNPRFRLLWASSVVNYMGLMFYFTVHGWLALTVTESKFWVGATFGFNGLSIMLFSTAAGVLADRLNRKYLILAALFFQVCVAAAIATLIFAEQIQLWHIIVTAFLDGAIMSVKVPSRTALVLDVAGRSNMLKATAANFAAMTSAGIVIPPIAGLMVDTHGIGWAYFAMSGLFAISGILLTFLRGVRRTPRKSEASPVQDFKNGVSYVFSTPAVRLLFVLMLTSELFGWAHETMMPVMADEVIDAGPTGLGYLLSAGSTGALVASLVLSAFGDIRTKGAALITGYIGFGLFLTLFALSNSLLISLVLIAAAHASAALYETMLGTLLQTTVPDEMRGRVLSFQMFSWGFTGFSGFHTGAIAALLGAPLAIGIGGGILVVNGLRLVRSLAGKYRGGESTLARPSEESIEPSKR
ncbi:MAG: MFS transporter [Chloroflexota bacterium]|nr:MFS transporter [Chloroflexota bacterium]